MRARSKAVRLTGPRESASNTGPPPAPLGRALSGAVAQLGERLTGSQEVDGSIPFSSTILTVEFPLTEAWDRRPGATSADCPDRSYGSMNVGDPSRLAVGVVMMARGQREVDDEAGARPARNGHRAVSVRRPALLVSDLRRHHCLDPVGHVRGDERGQRDHPAPAHDRGRGVAGGVAGSASSAASAARVPAANQSTSPAWATARRPEPSTT